MAHAICITETMSGTKKGVDLVSAHYVVGDTPTAIENGNVVLIGAYETGSREIREATTPAKDSDKANIALVASPEVIYSDRLAGDLGNFTNEAGAELRGYILEKPHQKFAVTGEALDGAAARIKGAVVELQAGTKLLAVAVATSGSTKIGEIIDVFTQKGKTYYAIETC